MNLIEKLAGLRLPCVPGEGPTRAKLVLLGEALGETEVLKLRPFVGIAGWFLEDVLRTAGVARGDCYVMNVVPTRPPENKIARLEELGISLRECEEWARQRLSELQPNCVLALGAVALRCLTGQSDITDWRGSILQVDVPGGIKIKVIPTFHPSYVQRLSEKTAKKEREGKASVKYTYGSARLSMTMDVRKAWQESRSPTYERPTRELIVSPSMEQVQSFFNQAKRAKRVAVDVETMGKWVDCVGFSYEPSSAICVPRGDQYWGRLTQEVEHLLQEILWNHAGLVAQNGAFDLIMLMGAGLPVRRLHFDTMIGHHFLHPELPHDLHYLCSVYTREPFYKWKLRAAKTKEERWEYNCLDSVTSLEIAEALVAELRESGVEREFFGYVMPLFHTVLKMGLRGCRVDLDFLSRLGRVLGSLIQRRERRVLGDLGLAGKTWRELGIVLKAKKDSPFNLGSEKQLKQLLYDQWKLPKQYNRKTRKLTVDDEALLRLSKLPGRGKIKGILDVRDVAKKKSTYAEVELGFGKRLRTMYSVTGTETGRLNSKQDLFGEGWNSQNAPKWFRKAVLPEPGQVILEADLKFAEALLIAWIARDLPTMEAVRSGADIYKWHGQRMLGVPMDQMDEATRDMVKPVVLGCGYGLGPDHLATMLGVSRAKGHELRELFFKSCPAILEYQETVRETLRKTRTLVTPFNRKRTFLGRLSEELFRKGFAFLPQSTCVEYLNRAMVRVDVRLPGALRLQVHDAMVLSVLREKLEESLGVIVEELAVPVWIHGEPLVIPTEIKVGEENWGKLQKLGVFNSFGKGTGDG